MIDKFSKVIDLINSFHGRFQTGDEFDALKENKDFLEFFLYAHGWTNNKNDIGINPNAEPGVPALVVMPYSVNCRYIEIKRHQTKMELLEEFRQELKKNGEITFDYIKSVKEDSHKSLSVF